MYYPHRRTKVENISTIYRRITKGESSFAGSILFGLKLKERKGYFDTAISSYNEIETKALVSTARCGS